MNPAARTVHIVDDDVAIRAALGWLFDSRGVPTSVYPSAEDFLQRFPVEHDGRVACLVLDIRMEGINGIELQDRLIAAGIQLPIIFLTGHGSVPVAVSALRKGAVDFIEKPFDGNALVDRVIACLDEESRRVQLRSRHVSVKEKLADLTRRDQQVMERVLAGKYNKVIADELGISMRTVEVHRSAILRKMGVRNAVELARLLADADSRQS
ncbi:MAG TPA: response regulator [Burkholderiaceae bacterium]|jgi:two-component system response regulator DctR|nr:response regulator [Burkholderiaceae bacterium]